MVSRRLARKTTGPERLKQLLDKAGAWTGEECTEASGYCGDGSGRGDYFTPDRVADLIFAAVRPLLGEGPFKILEPSAGIGRLLAPWHAQGRGHRLEAIETHHTYCRVLERLYPGLALSTESAVDQLQDRAGAYDVVIGNPPFGAAKGLLGKLGKGTLEAYFLEASLQALKPGGVLAMLVPDGLLSAARDAELRRWAMETYRLVGVISLPPETFIFSGTSVKTSVILLKNSGPCRGEDKVFMGLVEHIGWDSRGNPAKDDIPQVLLEYFRFLRSENLLESDVAIPVPEELFKELGIEGVPAGPKAGQTHAAPVAAVAPHVPQEFAQLSLLDEFQRAA